LEDSEVHEVDGKLRGKSEVEVASWGNIRPRASHGMMGFEAIRTKQNMVFFHVFPHLAFQLSRNRNWFFTN